MMFIPERYAKTVRIPIRIENGVPKFFYEGTLPKLREGTVGDLIIAAHAVIDDGERQRLDIERDRVLLPEGSKLLVEVSRPEMTHGLVKLASHEIDSPQSNSFVELILLEPLRAQLRSTKRARLHPCRCRIPALDEVTVSLNQGCTAISIAYEPWRLSHTANAFRKVFYRTKVVHGDFWRPLDVLREKNEAALERLIFKSRGRDGNGQAATDW
jgi:hypothetical protein